MSLEAVATAVHRAKTVLARNPQMGMHDDAPATCRWEHGVRCVTSHANGTRVPTDMPTEVGGSGDQVTPGWLFRAGLASCMATTLATLAAAEGLDITAMEVRIDSRSDSRGFLDMKEPDGRPVDAGPTDMRMHVRIAARGVPPARLRAFVEHARHCSPVPQALANATPIALEVEAA